MASEYEFKITRNTLDTDNFLKTLQLENDFYQVKFVLMDKLPEEITKESPGKYLVTFSAISKKFLLLDMFWLVKEENIACKTSEHFLDDEYFDRFLEAVKISRECVMELRKTALPLLKGNNDAQ